jgi:hypothetical protein
MTKTWSPGWDSKGGWGSKERSGLTLIRLRLRPKSPTVGSTFSSASLELRPIPGSLAYDARTKEGSGCQAVPLHPILCKGFWDLDSANLLRLHLIVLVGIA